jgi:hypothetical protein
VRKHARLTELLGFCTVVEDVVESDRGSSAGGRESDQLGRARLAAACFVFSWWAFRALQPQACPVSTLSCR